MFYSTSFSKCILFPAFLYFNVSVNSILTAIANVVNRLLVLYEDRCKENLIYYSILIFKTCLYMLK